MKARTRGAAAFSLGVGSGLCAWVFWAHGFLAAAATVLALLAGGLVVALVRERRASARLERALGQETERARQVSDHAWQSALLTQVVDELRTSPDEVAVLQTATTAPRVSSPSPMVSASLPMRFLRPSKTMTPPNALSYLTKPRLYRTKGTGPGKGRGAGSERL